MTARILIIDDDESMRWLLRYHLEKEGFRVLAACDGVEGVQLLQNQSPQLVLLDLMMPRMDGWETCRRIRECSDVPIIILTALSQNRDIVHGLEAGADDYVTKPFRNSELIARIHAVLRRGQRPFQEKLAIQIDDHLRLDRARCEVVVDGLKVALSPTEFKILDCLVANRGRILTHQSLLTQIWGWECADETDYLKVYICNLRKRIERNPHRPNYILTERGLGYRFQAQ